MKDKFDRNLSNDFDEFLDDRPLDPDAIPDDGMTPRYVLTPRQQAEKTQRMLDAVRALEEALPGRLEVDIEEDLIRTKKLTPDFDPETQTPLNPLHMEIETNLALLGLGQADDMVEPPTEGYIIVQYRSSDPVDKEHHLHFLEVEEVIEYIRSRIAPH